MGRFWFRPVGLPMPRTPQTTVNVGNLILLAAVGSWGGVLLLFHGHLIHPPLAVWALASLLAGAYVAGFEASTRRLAWLVAISAAAGYLAFVGGGFLGGMWAFVERHHAGYVVTAVFVLAALVAYGGAQALLGPALRRLRWRTSRLGNALIVVASFVLLLPLPGAGSLPDGFWPAHAVMALLGALIALRMSTATLLAVLAGGMVAGIAAELAFWPGSLPWALAGSWGLGMLLLYGLAGLAAGEPLVARPRIYREPKLYDLHAGHSMACGDQPLRVVSLRGEDKLALLERVLEQAGLAGALERRLAATGRTRETLAVAIKPNLMFLYSEHDRSTFTDPELVEHLVDWLRARGYRNLAVVEAQSAYGNYFEGRDVRHVAQVAGYRPGDRYRIVDLTEERVAHHFDGPLGDHFVGPTWRDADFRISFAKSKTHTWAWYTLCIKNVYGALALQDKIREYHEKREIYSPTIDMLVAFPVHFGLIDAFVGADGPFGIFADQHPNPTHTVIAGENILAVDWVGASKMGLDPMQSRYMQLAVQAFGPPRVELVGDGSVYPGWRNVPKPLIEFWDHAEESASFTSTVFAILNRDYMSPAFPRRPMSPWTRLGQRWFGRLGGWVYAVPPVPERPPRSAGPPTG
jgi:uncharacterized protein (DUF362 family)